jgi:AraC-like DNA-binding protein
MTDISAHLGDGDLSVAEVARRYRVTSRYLHKLFKSERLTFSSFVLGRRVSTTIAAAKRRRVCASRFAPLSSR